MPGRALSVGALRHFLESEPRLTLLVKAAFRFSGEEATIVGKDGEGAAPPISSGEPSPFPTAEAGAVHYASDFVPRKPRIDLLVVGHAYGPGDRIEAEIAGEGFSRRFVAVGAGATGKIPLAGAHVRESDGITLGRVGPKEPPVEPPPRMRYPEDFDFDVLAAAPPAQRLDDISLTAPLRIVNLSRRAPVRELRLPAVSPRLVLECTYDRAVLLDPPCDTVWIDTDGETCVVVWRAVVAAHAREVERILVSLEPVGEGRRGMLSLRREAPRWPVTFAAEPEHLSPEPEDADEEDDRQMVHYELLCAEHGVEPTISLATYAAISAELSEGREKRVDVLRRHGFDEDSWLLEERAWLEKTAGAAGEGDATLGAELGERTIEARDRLAAPAEADISLEKYAAITAAMEVRDPEKVLAEEKLSLPASGRLDRRFDEAMKNDPEMAARFETLLAEERGKVTPDVEPDVAEGEA
jgi:hypothetical protein